MYYLISNFGPQKLSRQRLQDAPKRLQDAPYDSNLDHKNLESLEHRNFRTSKLGKIMTSKLGKT